MSDKQLTRWKLRPCCDDCDAGLLSNDNWRSRLAGNWVRADDVEDLERQLAEAQHRYKDDEAILDSITRTVCLTGESAISVEDVGKRFEALKASLSEAQKDAERYRWLKLRLLSIGFDQESDGNVLSFLVPPSSRWSLNLDLSIDAAIAPPQSEKEK